MRATDIMSQGVVTVTADTPVSAVAALLIERRISALPVVDAEGRLIGMVTESDLLRRRELGTEKHRGRLAELFTANDTMEREYIRSHGRTAAELMSAPVIQVAPEASLAEIVDILEQHRIKRVPVVEDGRPVGIVSRSDMVRALAAATGAQETVNLTDRQIRKRLLEALGHLPWGKRARNSVVVKNGVVHYWGAVGTLTEFEALRVAAETIPGVVGVADHTVDLSEYVVPGF